MYTFGALIFYLRIEPCHQKFHKSNPTFTVSVTVKDSTVSRLKLGFSLIVLKGIHGLLFALSTLELGDHFSTSTLQIGSLV